MCASRFRSKHLFYFPAFSFIYIAGRAAPPLQLRWAAARALFARRRKNERTSAVFVLMSVVPFVNSNFLTAAARRTS
jgi:hypothetical protein